MLREYKTLINSISSQKKYCEGIWGGKSNNNYFLGIQLSVAKTPQKFSHAGSENLDKIMSFDLAEVANANCGQINMINVSSFCGPKGLIWGYDIAIAKKEKIDFTFKYKNTIIYDIEPLCNAFEKLLGSLDKPRFPFLPGSHVPCATKNIIAKGKCHLYAAEGIGIPAERGKSACLLMEDIGNIPLEIDDVSGYKKMILNKLVSSIFSIGYNQRVAYNEIFVGIKDIIIDNGEYGCAMAISPYFSIAEDAIPKDDNIFLLDIDSWENIVKNKFLYKNECL